MTENEAIKILKSPTKYTRVMDDDVILSSDFAKAYEYAIQALEELQQYRAIGTIEEFKALKDKSEPKKPIYKFEYENGTQFYDCPECKRYVTHSGVQSKEKYCSNCGIKLDWSE